MNKIFLIPIIVIFILGIGVFAWQYFRVEEKVIPEEAIIIEEEEIVPVEEKVEIIEEEVVKKNLIVVINENNNFRLIDSKGVEYAVLRTGVENEIMQWGAGLLSRRTSTPQIAGNKIFFIEDREIGKALKYIDLNNNLKELEFVESPSNKIISPDGQKIAWINNITVEPFVDNIALLVVSDINGKDIRIVFEEIFLTEERDGTRIFEFIRLIGWSEDSKRIYFTKNRITDEGMGGYMPLSIVGGENFFVIDVNNGQILKLIEDRGGIINFSSFSPDENIISFIDFNFIKNELSIRTYNWEDGKIIENITIPIPMLEEYGFQGNMFFSPNRRHILFSTAVGDTRNENEHFSVFVVDIDDMNFKRIIEKHPAFRGVGWLSDYEIVFTDCHWGEGDTSIINKDGSGLRKISEYRFMGLMKLTK